MFPRTCQHLFSRSIFNTKPKLIYANCADDTCKISEICNALINIIFQGGKKNVSPINSAVKVLMSSLLLAIFHSKTGYVRFLIVKVRHRSIPKITNYVIELRLQSTHRMSQHDILRVQTYAYEND